MTTARILLIVCLLGGLGLVVSGVYSLMGLGPALILAGVILLVVAAIIYRGLTDA
jgi:hypothetical protein